GRTMPITHLMSVDLPLPLVPSKTAVSPSLTSIDTPWSTRTAPYPASTFRTTSLFTEVGSFDALVGEDLVGDALGDLLADVEDGDALGEAHHRPHDVLDHDDGDPALVELEENRQDVVDLRARQSRHRLVGDEELRASRHRARELELAHLDLRERG